ASRLFSTQSRRGNCRAEAAFPDTVGLLVRLGRLGIGVGVPRSGAVWNLGLGDIGGPLRELSAAGRRRADFPARPVSNRLPRQALGGGLEMNHSALTIGFGKLENFLGLAASWFVVGSIFQTLQPPLEIFLAWVLITSALSLASLRAIGYFGHYKPR